MLLLLHELTETPFAISGIKGAKICKKYYFVEIRGFIVTHLDKHLTAYSGRF